MGGEEQAGDEVQRAERCMHGCWFAGEKRHVVIHLTVWVAELQETRVQVLPTCMRLHSSLACRAGAGPWMREAR